MRVYSYFTASAIQFHTKTLLPQDAGRFMCEISDEDFPCQSKYRALTPFRHYYRIIRERAIQKCHQVSLRKSAGRLNPWLKPNAGAGASPQTLIIQRCLAQSLPKGEFWSTPSSLSRSTYNGKHRIFNVNRSFLYQLINTNYWLQHSCSYAC